MIGPEDLDCVFSLHQTTDFSVSEDRCRVRRSKRRVALGTADTLQIPGDCDPVSANREGIGFDNRQVPQRGVELRLPGLGFLVSYLDQQAGQGPPLAVGDRATIEVTLRGPLDAIEFQDLPSGLAAPVQLQRRRLELVVGEARYGHALDAVLLGAGEPMKLGGSRTFKIPTVGAKPFRRFMPELLLETTKALSVEVTLVSASGVPAP